MKKVLIKKPNHTISIGIFLTSFFGEMNLNFCAKDVFAYSRSGFNSNPDIFDIEAESICWNASFLIMDSRVSDVIVKRSIDQRNAGENV